MVFLFDSPLAAVGALFGHLCGCCCFVIVFLDVCGSENYLIQLFFCDEEHF